MTPASEILAFFTEFSRRLDRATGADSLHTAILDAFAHVTRSSMITLWSVNLDRAEYRLRACLGSDCRSLSMTFPESPALSHALSAGAAVVDQEGIQQSLPPESASALNQILSACHSAVVVPLIADSRLIGFCTVKPADSANLHDTAVAAPLHLAAQMSASALQRWLIKEADLRSQTLLRRTNRLRSLEIMAGGFAHEIRNPLTSIKTFVQLAPQRREDARFIHEFSRIAVQDIHRIEQLLEEVLDYARYIVPAPTEQDVNELVSSCLSFIAAKASSRSIRLRADLADGLPLLWLDRQQIKQAVINLLLNALEAAQDSSKEIAVRTFIAPRPDGGRSVCIEIRDDGRGIPPQHLDHIFDPFFTTQHSNSAGDIRGLGLTIAHQIVREHQGDLTVESRAGLGSTFCLCLPIGVGHPPVCDHTGAT
ncbi:MAG TPA: ATP-binding protein [Nitrospiraceae bacterium]|nr:ATP-binding protein [Nitrospiraceae bacterium]